MANFLNLYTPQAVLPALAASFNMQAAGAGLAVTAPLIAVAMVAPFAGAISDRIGRRVLIVGALFLLVVPTLLIATSPSMHILLLWRFLQGVLLPFIFAVCVAYIGDEIPGPAGIRAASLYSAGTIFGGFGGRFVAGLVAEWAGWRMGFVAVAGLTFALFLLLLFGFLKHQLVNFFSWHTFVFGIKQTAFWQHKLGFQQVGIDHIVACDIPN